MEEKLLLADICTNMYMCSFLCVFGFSILFSVFCDNGVVFCRKHVLCSLKFNLSLLAEFYTHNAVI